MLGGPARFSPRSTRRDVNVDDLRVEDPDVEDPDVDDPDVEAGNRPGDPGMTARAPALLALLLVAGAACDEPKEPLEPLTLPAGCQPLLGGHDCLLPYPSDFFRAPDDEMATGFRVELTDAAKLVTDDGYSADVNDWSKTDGFSRTTPILALLGSEVTGAGLVGIFDDYAESAQSGSRTLLLDTETGAFVPHFVDLDPNATDPLRQAIVLRPMIALEEQRRYVVALQGLEAPSGAAAKAPEAFRRLRDGESAQDPALAALQARYDREVFAPLARAGVVRDGLQLAWDFTTGSDAWAVGDMLRARELALSALAAEPPVVTIDAVEEVNEGRVWRRVTGTVEGPLVLEHADPGAHLARDDDGRVRLNGRARFPFTAIVPACVRDGYAPGLVLQYGHGFFGTRAEVDSGSTQRIFDEVCAVGFGIDWWGMSTPDVGVLIAALGEQVWRSVEFTERVPQAMVNWLTLTAAIDGALEDEAAFRRPDTPGAPGVVEDPASPGTTNAGEPVYAKDRIHFLGISLGHILGGVYTSLNPAVSRAVLHVGGASFTNMMFRAKPFERLLAVLSLAVTDPLEQQKVAASFQRHFDPIDPATYARFLLADPLPSGPDGGAASRRVLMQAGLADGAVPNFASFLHARHVGLPAVGPQPVPLFGLDAASAPHEGSGFAAFDLGYDTSFSKTAAFPAEESPVHVSLRTKPEVLEQMRVFLQEGRIVHPCDGPCRLD